MERNMHERGGNEEIFALLEAEPGSQQELLKELPHKLEQFVKWAKDPLANDRMELLEGGILQFIDSINNKSLVIKIIWQYAEKNQSEKQLIAELVRKINV